MTTRTHPSMGSARPSMGSARLISAGAFFALAAAACTGGTTPVSAPSSASEPPRPAATSTPIAKPLVTATKVPPVRVSLSPDDNDEGTVPTEIVDAAVADAAARAGVDPAAVTVLSTEAVTWPNGALGCPQPGSMYTQALTPGYRVVVEGGGTRYDYRATQAGGDVRWCEDPPGPG